jgi:hypothetical protein
MNKTSSEIAAVVGNIDPDAYAASTVTTNEYIPLKHFRRFMAIIQAGDIVSTGTIDAKLITYTNSSGSGAADVTGSAITQLTQAGTDSNKQVVINFDPSKLAGSTATHFRLSVTMGTAGADLSAIVLGLDPLYGPASDNDVATVDEIVTA